MIIQLAVLFFSLITILIFSIPIKSEAASYPSTSIEIKAGDIIYSPKNSSTYFVGHIGIVGSDGKVYHSYPDSDGKRVNTVSDYINNLFGTSEVIVRRYNGNGIDLENVGSVAMAIHGNIKAYAFGPDLRDYYNNYCSKFVWQAYYMATGIDPLEKGYDYYTTDYILPSEFKTSSKFTTVKTYVR